MLQNNIDKTCEYFMQEALDQAVLARNAEEVPIGAIVVERDTGQIISRAYNQTIRLCDPTAHAEILVLRDACRQYGAQRIPQCDLYVTLEPCPMCAAALCFARIGHVYYGATDEKSGGFISGPALAQHRVMHHKPSHSGGHLGEISAEMLKQFFKARR